MDKRLSTFCLRETGAKGVTEVSNSWWHILVEVSVQYNSFQLWSATEQSEIQPVTSPLRNPVLPTSPRRRVPPHAWSRFSEQFWPANGKHSVSPVNAQSVMAGEPATGTQKSGVCSKHSGGTTPLSSCRGADPHNHTAGLLFALTEDLCNSSIMLPPRFVPSAT